MSKLLLAAALAVGAAGAVQAHATLETAEAPVGSTYKAVLRVPHGCEGEATLKVRVQVPEVWDAVRFSAPPDEPALALKVQALELLYPDAAFHDDFVLKLHGFEVLDEGASLADVGAADGSIFLLTHRRRRPVR